MIALLGVAAETASMMVVYLDEGFDEGARRRAPAHDRAISIDAIDRSGHARACGRC